MNTFIFILSYIIFHLLPLFPWTLGKSRTGVCICFCISFVLLLSSFVPRYYVWNENSHNALLLLCGGFYLSVWARRSRLEVQSQVVYIPTFPSGRAAGTTHCW